MKNLKRLVIMSLMAALTTVATMAIQIPTPLSGYIHLGDSIVLLSGIILGPLGGAVAAGIGSMMADIITGYFIYAPATLVIKSLTAFVIGITYRKISTGKVLSGNHTFLATVSGVFGAIVMVFGYFIYELFLYGIAASAANMVFNAFQGLVGILVAILLLPMLFKIPDVKVLMTFKKANHY